MTLSFEALPDRAALMQRAAEEIAAALNQGVANRGRACAALSGRPRRAGL